MGGEAVSISPRIWAMWRYRCWEALSESIEHGAIGVRSETRKHGCAIPASYIGGVLASLLEDGLVERRVSRGNGKHKNHDANHWRRMPGSFMEKAPEFDEISATCISCGRPVALYSKTSRAARGADKHALFATCSQTCRESPKIKRLLDARTKLLRSKHKALAASSPSIGDTRQHCIAELVGAKQLRKLGLKVSDL